MNLRLSRIVAGLVTRFCVCVFTPPDGNTRPLAYLSPLDLAKGFVRRFNPC